METIELVWWGPQLNIYLCFLMLIGANFPNLFNAFSVNTNKKKYYFVTIIQCVYCWFCLLVYLFSCFYFLFVIIMLFINFYLNI